MTNTTVSSEKLEDTVSYFQKRMDVLGVTNEINKVSLHKTELQTGKAIMLDVPIFREVEKGIEILVYTLDRSTIRIEKNGTRMKSDFSMIRLKNPIVKDGGDVIKYLIPKGAGTYPFFPPMLLDKYDAGEQIHTLFLIEGYFKAFKAAMEGANIIGLSSITHMKDKDNGKLHADIMRMVVKCNVQRIVWLTDGDALDITQKEITDGIDLYRRPNGFFQSVNTFFNLTSDLKDIQKWFMHIDSDAIMGYKTGITRDQVKGLDDLLCCFDEKKQNIIADMETVAGHSVWFQKFNITYGLRKVHQHFHLDNVNQFFLFHAERRPELKGNKFKFSGTTYEYNEEKAECIIVMPKESKDYFRVADHYYKFIMVPNQFNKPERQFHERKKSTIVDDHGKEFPKHIPKYEAFCNVPDHTNFQPVIDRCFNVYSPLDYTPDDEECFAEDCPTIMNFINHVFGQKMTSFVDKNSGKKEYTTYEMALDYFQLLYQTPQQKLPILCLVSKENNTGKSTVGNFLRMMLGANVAIVGNADLAGDFNAHWATKNVVVCDETKIDKQHVIEKIKMLSTAKKLFMNAKGRGQVELDCFIKFVLITNNEDSFISATDDDIRYWVIKVPVLRSENPSITKMFEEEMPAFLSFISKRKLKTELQNRMWFHPKLLRTDAFYKVVAQSQPAVEKELRHWMKEMFLDTGLKEIRMTASIVHKEIFRNSTKYDIPYLSKIIKDNLKIDHYHLWTVEGINREYVTYAEGIAAAQVKFPDCEGYMIEGKLSKKYKVVRYTYPRMEEVIEQGKKEVKRMEVGDQGRPFVFARETFVSDAENRQTDAGAENNFISSMDIEPTASPKTDDLPF